MKEPWKCTISTERRIKKQAKRMVAIVKDGIWKDMYDSLK